MREVHLILLWSEARWREAQILEDLTARFRLLDLVEVSWSPDHFARNLTCLYGSALPPGSDKERHSGTGPFLVAVVEDVRPRQRPRRLRRRWAWVNPAVMDARRRYRALTGGGYRVHASENPQEADRDLVLLLGRRASEFLTSTPPPVPVARRHDADVVGADGWRDVDELLLALEVTAGQRVVEPVSGVDLAVVVSDLWWANQLLGGREDGPGTREIRVGGRPFRLALTEAPPSSWDARRRIRALLPPRAGRP